VNGLDFQSIGWPASRLGEAITALARKVRLGNVRHEVANPPGSQNADELRNWIEWAANRLGCEATPLPIPFREMRSELAVAFPALLQCADDVFLVVIGGNGKRLSVLTPSLDVRRVSIHDLEAVLREPAERALREEWTPTLDEAGLSVSKRQRTLNLLLDEQASGKRFDTCWILGGSAHKGVLGFLREAHAVQNAGGLLAAHIARYLLWIASWGVLGSLSFAGRIDRGWMLGWALLLVTLIPFQLWTTWLQGLFAIGVGAWLKRRLLRGSLRLPPEQMRQGGIGSFLGQAIEAQAIESLSVSGGIAGLLAVIELSMAAFLLGRFALVLVAWCAVALLAGWRFMRRYADWTTSRMDMTQDLVENMVGYRTRLVQQRKEEWHRGEDQALDNYFQVSSALDRTGSWLAAAIPRGWLIAGLACLAPSLVAGTSVSAQTAVLLGGVLLAYGAFQRLAGSFTDLAAGWVAWKRIKPLFDAAGREEPVGEVASAGTVRAGQKVLETDRLTFRYKGASATAVRGCSVAVRCGDRILLEGPSGGGKTTFASLLSGLREAESGLLLVNGLDRHVLGADKWRRAVASAPQFHENHILTETLAFNLLMGRNWPPSANDMAEAESLCRELGLGDLLDRMPSGLLQMVGEGGWQLSHGEKSRVYIARALLQQANLVILDESFAALDPENLKLALQCTLKRAETLMVIAHP
jgi:ATP-binding cassette subfamily B protein